MSYHVFQENPMTAPDSRDSVERVVAEMRERSDTSDDCCYGTIGTRCVRDWADRLQALARGPQQAGGEDALQAEVARLTAAEQESFQKFVDTNEQRIELLADARQLAASVHGAFGALGSDPPEPILKLANRYFLMKRRGRRSAALNGGQDDA